LNWKQIIAGIVLGAVFLVSGLFVLTPFSQTSTTSSLASTSTQTVTLDTSPPLRNLSWYGNVTNLSAMLPSTDIANVNSSSLSSLNLTLVQLREQGAIQVYNSTGATSFVPGWVQNFTLLIEAEGNTNYTYPFNETPKSLEQFCNYNSTNGPTGCTILTTITQTKPNIQVTNFTVPDGEGWVIRDYAAVWINGSEYTIISAGFSISQIMQIADSMEPASSITS
jgi:hypothetical protein